MSGEAMAMCRGAGLLAALTCGMLLVFGEVALGRRLALVIGNDDYVHIPKLSRSIGDSRAIKEVLERLGYEVTAAENLDFRNFTRTLIRFTSDIAAEDEVVIHYSGHGVSSAGRNYLVPVDLTEPESNATAEITAFSIDAAEAVEMALSRRPKFVFTILDACRNSPFALSTRSTVAERGLRRMETGSGAFILFSAGEGEAALDRLSPNDGETTSVFTRVLLKYLATSGMTLQKIAKATQSEVRSLAATVQHRQFPDYSDRTIDEPILNAPSTMPLSPLSQSTRENVDSSISSGADPEKIAFEQARRTGTVSAFVEYLRREDPRYADQARLSIIKLKHSYSLSDYTFDIPDLYPIAMEAYQKMIPAELRNEDWLYNLDVVSGPMKKVVMNGYEFIVASGCKPHNCDTHFFNLAMTEHGYQIYILIKTPKNSELYLGGPKPYMKEFLRNERSAK